MSFETQDFFSQLRLSNCMSEIGINIIRRSIEHTDIAMKITVFISSLLALLALMVMG